MLPSVATFLDHSTTSTEPIESHHLRLRCFLPLATALVGFIAFALHCGCGERHLGGWKHQLKRERHEVEAGSRCCGPQGRRIAVTGGARVPKSGMLFGNFKPEWPPQWVERAHTEVYRTRGHLTFKNGSAPSFALKQKTQVLVS